tara:strand:- start:157 stop:1104 length:948 start_codon:yes stop_codon:yes gene_type:complete
MTKLTKIKGDASFRSFFRKINIKRNSIIVVAKKEKFKNLLVYDAINKILLKNKILAPYLYNENYSKNFIEIQDFGKKTMFNELNKKGKNKFIYFKKIIKLLIKIQSIKNRQINTFKNKKYFIPKYEKKILIQEANLFCDWYVKNNFSKNGIEKFSKEFKKVMKNLASKLTLKENVFVHRDFHVSNLMLVKKNIGVIDSQDALFGNRAYDLASLIDDVRLKTSKSFKKKIFNYYLKKQKKINTHKFKNDFEILSIMRNLKIIGIFTRLAIRDGKKNYLKLIPYTWKLISMRIEENEAFKDLKNLLNQKFKKKLNEN